LTDARRRVTALDVARAAGVSKTTVSYVLNDTPHQTIPDETRQRVLAAVQELSYIPMSAARALRRGHNDTVLLVMPDWPLARVLALLLDALAIELESRGLSLMIRRHQPGQRISPMCQELAPAAVIAVGDVEEEDQRVIREAGIFVAAALLTSDSSAQGAVAIPQDVIGALQVQHLAVRGHHRLGYAVPASDRFAAFFALRVDGARRACRDLGLSEPDVVELDLTVEAASAAVRRWVESSPPVTGVVAYNDEFAGALLAGLRTLGKSAPADLAVIGVDNDPHGRFTAPSLTTIDQHPQEVARHLAELVASSLTGESAFGPLRAPGPSVIVRQSS
jgi:DNA-binding LacI/PurR family transcriptional regulator